MEFRKQWRLVRLRVRDTKSWKVKINSVVRVLLTYPPGPGLDEAEVLWLGLHTLHVHLRTKISTPQSRQSAKRFSSRWNWDSPTPLAAGECAPPPFGPGGRAHSLGAKGVGESQFQRGDIHCGALYI